MFDPERGTAAQIAAAGYALRQPASSYQPWTDSLLRHLGGFGRFVAVAGLPGEIQKQVAMGDLPPGGGSPGIAGPSCASLAQDKHMCLSNPFWARASPQPPLLLSTSPPCASHSSDVGAGGAASGGCTARRALALPALQR
jgi:hypothetical protein